MKRNIRNCRAIIITHGKAEAVIAETLKRSLRLPIEIFPGADNKNRSSIQLTSINTVLNNTEFGSFAKFKATSRFSTVSKGKKDIEDCKIFIIMDTDDCAHAGKPHLEDDFKTKKMFEGHWLYPHIVPIYNTPNLEIAMKSIGHDIPHDVKAYIKFFGAIKPNEFEEFWKKEVEKLSKVKTSNMEELITYCIDWAKELQQK